MLTDYIHLNQMENILITLYCFYCEAENRTRAGQCDGRHEYKDSGGEVRRRCGESFLHWNTGTTSTMNSFFLIFVQVRAVFFTCFLILQNPTVNTGDGHLPPRLLQCPSGLPACSTKLLQKVQNVVAHLVFNQPKRAHVTPLLIDLYWLRVTARINHKSRDFCL